MAGSILPTDKSAVDSAIVSGVTYMRGVREWIRRQKAMWGDQAVDGTVLTNLGYDTATKNNILAFISWVNRMDASMDGTAVGAGDNLEFLAANMLGISGN